MKKNLKYFENELSRLNKEFADYKKKYIGTPEIGKVIELAGMDWLILDKTEKGYFAILNGFDEKERTFDSTSNNWITSKLRNELNARFLKKITDELGKDAVIEFDRDLLSMDGQTEYGHCKDKISFLTVDEYRKYRKLLPNMDKWWWLLTPWSTPVNDFGTTITVVSPSGIFNLNSCFSGSGVRPVCIFSSSIFESGNYD